MLNKNDRGLSEWFKELVLKTSAGAFIDIKITNRIKIIGGLNINKSPPWVRIPHPLPVIRGIAQSGSAPALGAGGPRFKSWCPDIHNYSGVAQLVEQWAVNPRVTGSSPVARAN